MQNLITEVLHYAVLVLKTTGLQLLTLFGPLIVLALIINFISRVVQNLGFSVFGHTIYLYGFAWLGIAIHEISHAIFVIIFGHKLNKIVLFSPKSDGTLGYVEHSYNEKNVYQKLGNFFIGLGPVIVGPILLYFVIIYFLGGDVVNKVSMPIDFGSFTDFNYIKTFFESFFDNLLFLINEIYISLKDNYIQLIIFSFIIFSVGSSISMSPSDIEGSKMGFFYFVGLLTLFNVVTLWFGDFSSGAIHFLEGYISIIYPIIILSIVLNIIFAAILVVLKISKLFLYIAIISAIVYALFLVFFK